MFGTVSIKQSVKRFLKRCVVNLGQYVLARPHLKRCCLRILEHFPHVENRLASAIYGHGGLEGAQRVSRYEQLSPMGREVHSLLIAVKRQEKTHYANSH